MKPEAKRLPAKIENLEPANAFVEDCYGRAGMDAEKKFKVLLALEEAFVNICHYAYPDGEGDVEIACCVEDDAFVLTVADTGMPFDVLSLPDPDTTLGIDDRAIGGLGILLIRTLSSPSYSRVNARNVLKMTFAV